MKSNGNTICPLTLNLRLLKPVQKRKSNNERTRRKKRRIIEDTVLAVGKITKGMEKALMSGDMRHRPTRDMKEECELVGGCGGPPRIKERR